MQCGLVHLRCRGPVVGSGLAAPPQPGAPPIALGASGAHGSRVNGSLVWAIGSAMLLGEMLTWPARARPAADHLSDHHPPLTSPPPRSAGRAEHPMSRLELAIQYFQPPPSRLSRRGLLWVRFSHSPIITFPAGYKTQAHSTTTRAVEMS